MTTAAPVIRFEIGCKNSEATTQFYREAFDWEINSMGPMSVVQAAESGIAGHINSLGHEPHNYVTIYIHVSNIDEYLERIEKLGGKRLVGPVQIPMGRFAWFNDPEGNMIALFEKRQ